MTYFRSILQDVVADANNSSTDDLDAGNTYLFEGDPTSTLGVAGIQVSLFANKNCLVSIQQSPDATPHWDLIDEYHYTASTNFGVTVQAVSSYVRVVVTTNAETTTVFRLQTALCPIVEAVPRSLDSNGNFKIASPVDSYGWGSENTPMGEMRVSEPVRLVGTVFEGATIDTKFWTCAATGTAAAVAQASAQLLLTSGTANLATVTAFTVRRARYVGGAAMRYRAVVQATAGVTNNVRRWGIAWGSTAMPTVTDGAWFMWNGTTFQIQTMKGGSAATVTSFNGNLGATYDPGTGAKTYEIYWTNSKVYFVVGDEILHTVSASAATWANTMQFHAFADSVNSDAIAAGTTLAMRTATIYRLGKLETLPQYAHIAGATTTVCKYGAGTLHRIVINTPGTLCTVYDNSAGSGTPVIAIIDTSKATGNSGTLDFNAPFFNGLSLVTTNAATDITVIYE